MNLKRIFIGGALTILTGCGTLTPMTTFKEEALAPGSWQKTWHHRENPRLSAPGDALGVDIWWQYTDCVLEELWANNG